MVKIRQQVLIFLIALIHSVIFAKPLLSNVYINTHSYYQTFIIFILSILITHILFVLFLNKWTICGLTITFFILSAICLYCISTYGIVIDLGMLRNAFQTDYKEVSALINFRLFLYIVTGAFCAILILRIFNIHYLTFWKECLQRLLSIGVSILLLCFVVSVNSRFIFPLVRTNHPEYLLMPLNYVVSIIVYGVESINIKNINDNHVIDANAKVATWNRKNNLVILVIGETARSKSFSLNGYDKNTNEPLMYDDVISFKQFFSCGTATAVSVPCMFSHLSRKSFSLHRYNKHDNILDLLTKVGVSVSWINNNSGCKGVCKYVTNVDVATSLSKTTHENCYDEDMIELIPKLIKTNTDNLIILHQLGSHGPEYYMGVPDKLKKFHPECRTNYFDRCTNEQLVNSYDNTIHYTSYVLSKAIAFLKKYDSDYNTALIYMSDHGESLGENGRYLHGMPYFMAPIEQIHIPAIMWISENFASENNVDIQCLKAKVDDKLSHDYLFHTLLRIFNVETQSYDNTLDLFDKCIYKLK